MMAASGLCITTRRRWRRRRGCCKQSKIWELTPPCHMRSPNYISHALLIPDDPRYVDQWHYPLINLPAAWDITTGSDDVVIAVIDSGIRPHVDLWDRVLRETRFIGPGPGDVVGYDFIRPIDPDPIDPAGLRSSFHGTHVAGTIGAETNNGQGVAGVTWQGKIMPLRVLNSSGSGKHYDIIQAIYYAADWQTVPVQFRLVGPTSLT